VSSDGLSGWQHVVDGAGLTRKQIDSMEWQAMVAVVVGGVWW